MTSTGDIKPCLCYEQRWALKPALRMEHKEKRQESIQKILIESIKNKPQMHCFEDVKACRKNILWGRLVDERRRYYGKNHRDLYQ